MIGAAGQGKKFVPELRCYTCVVHGHCLDILIPVIKFLLRIRLKELVIPEYIVAFVIDL